MSKLGSCYPASSQHDLHELSDFVIDVPMSLELPVHDAMLCFRTRKFNGIVQGLDGGFQVLH